MGAGWVSMALAMAWGDPALAASEALAGFVHVGGFSGVAGCLPEGIREERLQEQVEQTLGELALDPDFAVVLTTDILTCPDLFYVPVKNDVRGIGYQHLGVEEFDDSVGTRLQGVAFLNDLPYWLENEEEFGSAFLHELGHRWLARIHALDGDQEVDLTGRQGGHWSYFLDTDGSPLEGNDFGEGPTARTQTPSFPSAYSALDLYLMGALPPESVPPFRLLEPGGDPAGEDCRGAAIVASSPPQICGNVSLPGLFRELNLDQVIAAEGPRVPASDVAQREFSVALLLFDPEGRSLQPEQCQTLSLSVSRLIDLFERATQGELRLTNLVEGGGDCAALPVSASPTAGSCATSFPPRPSARALVLLSGLLLLGAVRRSRGATRLAWRASQKLRMSLPSTTN